MFQFKRIVCLILAFSMIAAAGCSKAEVPTTTSVSTGSSSAPTSSASSGRYSLGDKMDDFTITTADGKELSLYSILEEKKMVLINFWASWCGPCAAEFPYMQASYELYKDKVEVLALDIESTDTDEYIIEYGTQLGLTFPLASERAGLAERFGITAYPCSVAVDRFGTICLISTGAETNDVSFSSLFALLSSDEYTESHLFNEFPGMLPTVNPLPEAELTPPGWTPHSWDTRPKRLCPRRRPFRNRGRAFRFRSSP